MFQKTALLLLLTAFLTGCHSLRHHKKCPYKKKSLSGHAEVHSVSDSSVKGWVHFEWAGKKKVKVSAEVEGLKPNGVLGFHVHEFGNCGNQALNAGGHFNPHGRRHGAAGKTKERHLGDLGNLKADSAGKAIYTGVIHGKVYKFLGRSVVIHSKADDFKTQPAGNSGARLACGVIGAMKSTVSNNRKTSAESQAKSSAEEPVAGKPVTPPSVPVVQVPKKPSTDTKQAAVPVVPAVVPKKASTAGNKGATPVVPVAKKVPKTPAETAKAPAVTPAVKNVKKAATKTDGAAETVPSGVSSEGDKTAVAKKAVTPKPTTKAVSEDSSKPSANKK